MELSHDWNLRLLFLKLMTMMMMMQIEIKQHYTTLKTIYHGLSIAETSRFEMTIVVQINVSRLQLKHITPV